MKKLTIIMAAAAGLALSAATSQAQLSLAFSSTGGSENYIDFGPDSIFNFNGTFTVTTSSGMVTGSFLGGPFTIGTITTSGTTQTASVLTTGTVNIGGLTADINWVNIESQNSGSDVGLNDSLVVNLTDLSYSGANSDLLTLVADAPDSLTLDMTFDPAKSLTTLTGGGTYKTSYSGTIYATAVPEASTAMAGALMLLPLGIGAIRAVRKERTV